MAKVFSGQDRERKWHDAIPAAIDEFWKVNHHPPTIRDIMNITGCPSTSVVKYNLRACVSRGRIRITEFGHPIPVWVDELFERTQNEAIVPSS